MSLIKWEPFGDLDNFFSDFSRSGLRCMSGDLAVDVYEEEGKVVAEMNFLYFEKISLEGELTIEKVSPGYQKVWGKYHLNTPQKSESSLTINGDFEASIQKD